MKTSRHHANDAAAPAAAVQFVPSTTLRPWLAVVYAALLCPGFDALAQPGSDPGSGKRAFEISDYYRAASVGSPHLSPESDRVVFSVGRTDLESGESWSDLWSMDANGGDLHQLTHLKKSHSSPSFAPDGKHILFASNRSGDSQLYLMSARGGEARQLTDFPLGLSDPLWSPDGRFIAATTDLYPECGVDPSCNQHIADAVADGPLQVHVTEELLYRHWTHWDDGRKTHIVLIDARSGNVVEDLTPGGWISPTFSAGGGRGFDFSPDGRELCFVSNRGEDPAGSTNTDLWLVTVDGGERKHSLTGGASGDGPGGPRAPVNITDANEGFDGAPLYSPDGSTIAFLSQETPGYESDLIRLALYDRRGGGIRYVTDRQRFDNWVTEIAWGPKGDKLYAQAEGPGVNPLYEVRLDAKDGESPLREIVRDAYIQGWTVSPDGKYFYYNRRSIDRPLEIHRHRAGRGDVERLTHFNQSLEDEVDIRPGEELWIEMADGHKIHCWLIKPHGFDPDRQYPLIINVHGGPQGQWKDRFRGDWQVYPGKGYVVAMPNPTGSTGFGQDLVDGIACDWGGRIVDEIMATADYLEALPYVDPKRTGLMGWSYGGYMVMWLQGQTDRFAASAAMMGIYDLPSFYGGTEELWFPEKDLCGAPWSSKSYQDWNPANHVANFKTPCLVITGELDFRVPYTQSLQYYTALQRQDVPSRLVVFPNAGHWPSWLEMAFYYNEHLAWFAQYLGGEPAPYDRQAFSRNLLFGDRAGE